MTAEEFAPAKVNLTLHVTGRQSDGYHLLDSLVAFIDAGDRIRATPAPAGELSLEVTGPYAHTIPSGDDNLVLRAARMLRDGAAGRGGEDHAAKRVDCGARLTLEKNLPPSSGIGGGSSDAAAAIRALSRLWDVALPGNDSLAALGADVPVCLAARTMRMRGIGQTLSPVPPLPAFHLVMVNPGIAVPTPMVFAALEAAGNPPMTDRIPSFASAWDLVAWMHLQRNDLEAPAMRRAPQIRAAVLALSLMPGCMLSRMSGSGATCFGMFETAEAATHAQTRLQARHPEWWVRAAQPLSASAPEVPGVTDKTADVAQEDVAQEDMAQETEAPMPGGMVESHTADEPSAP